MMKTQEPCIYETARGQRERGNVPPVTINGGERCRCSQHLCRIWSGAGGGAAHAQKCEPCAVGGCIRRHSRRQGSGCLGLASGDGGRDRVNFCRAPMLQKKKQGVAQFTASIQPCTAAPQLISSFVLLFSVFVEAKFSLPVFFSFFSFLLCTLQLLTHCESLNALNTGNVSRTW